MTISIAESRVFESWKSQTSLGEESPMVVMADSGGMF